MKIKRLTESQVYYPQTIPDRREEFERIAREASMREHQRSLDERRRKEDAKNARILASKEDKYLHAINLIIEHREAKDNPIYLGNGNDPTSFSIPYYFFNFEDHIQIRDLLEAFLFKLKNAGCFEDFGRSPATTLGSSMVFHKINLDKLKEYRNTMIKDKEKNGGLKTRYDQLLDEIKSKQKSPDLRERYEKIINEITPTIADTSLPNEAVLPLPKDVGWIENEGKLILTFKNGHNLEFINPNKPTAKYFKLLIEHHGLQVKHKKVPEVMSGITKDKIENLKKALNKKIRNAGLSSRITITTKYEGGYTLQILPPS